MEVVITEGSYKWRAVIIQPILRLPWLCQEFSNEKQINSYVASTEHVLGMTEREIKRASELIHV